MLWIAVILVIFLTLPVGLFVLSSTHSDDSYTSKVSGVWSTSIPTAFYARTNWLTGSMQDAGIEIRDVTFIIKATADPAKVDVTMSFIITSSSIDNTSMYGDATSPEYYTGTINGDTLVLDRGHGPVATFTISDTTLAGTTLVGTWDESSGNDYFAQDTFTAVNGLTLYKQSVAL